MLANAKALIVVLALAVPAFYIAGQISEPFIPRREFVLWRNAWFAVTAAAFLSNNFFVFALIVAMICMYVRSDATVGLYYILLFAAPQVDVPIAGFGLVNELLALNNGRVLAIALLLPMLVPKGGSIDQESRAYRTPDLLVVSYVLLLTVLEFRKSDLTNVLRVGTTNALDILMPYFAFSRTVRNVPDFQKALLGFVIAALSISLVSVLEVAKGWHLYGEISSNWGGALNYLHREGILRAAGTAEGGITLGYVFMVAIGCALPFWQQINPSRRFVGVAFVMLFAGLVAALSRGPWIGVAVLVTVYLATGPKPVEKLGKVAIIASTILAPLLLTPAGGTIIKFLPFVGSVEEENITYRQRLFENGLSVVEQNPWFGSADYLSTPEMLAMLQGEGIIDLVNSYLQVALKSGLIGLSLFLGFFVTILIGLRRLLKDIYVSEFAGASIATLVAILVTIATVSSVDFIPFVYWSFAGLSVALIRIGYRHRAAATRLRYGGNFPGPARFAKDRT
jgi:O-antigen ligase